MENFITLNPYFTHSTSKLISNYTFESYSQLTSILINSIKSLYPLNIIIYPAAPSNSLITLSIQDILTFCYMAPDKIIIMDSDTGLVRVIANSLEEALVFLQNEFNSR